ncbi:MAG: monofunctional biosynthetic peptidoglycan transglycosylase [Prevotella sp.]|nr:monofunctional biosynthetic peptidoglycan transglycosylase [Prevotella sp.]
MKLVLKIITWVLALFFGTTILAVLLFRHVPVYATPLMFIRLAEQAKAGSQLRLYHRWMPLDEMAPSMPVAVMASEDQRFLLHHGFDVQAIKAAQEHNKTGKTMHGASTISQQTAKNVFLWPGRSWLRKGLEAYFTVLIELLWDKHRIMEVYLNSIEMGDGIYGTFSAAKHKFGRAPAEMTRGQCALLAATLPNPRRFDAANPSAYMLKRQRQIEQQMKFIPLFPKKGEKINPKTVSGGIYAK